MGKNFASLARSKNLLLVFHRPNLFFFPSSSLFVNVSSVARPREGAQKTKPRKPKVINARFFADLVVVVVVVNADDDDDATLSLLLLF